MQGGDFHGPRCRSRIKPKWAALVLAAWPVAWLACGPAYGQQVDTWIGGSSDWDTASNWSTAAVPGAGDTVDIVDSDGVSRTITYDYTGPTLTLAAVNVSLTGGDGTASEIFSMSGNTLAATVENVGGYAGSMGGGVGTFDQAGGLNAVGSGGLYLGYNSADQGSYSLSAGTLAASQFNSREYVGYSGDGNFIQSAGYNNTGTLYLGFASGSNGVYTLSGESTQLNLLPQLNPTLEFVGYAGTGSFIESTSGSNHMQTLSIGALAGSTGQYLMSAGGISASLEYVGQGGVGTFNQSAGSNNAGSLVLAYSNGATGSYVLSGSAYLAGSEVIGNSGNGAFTQTGGTNNAQVVSIGNLSGSTGSYAMSGTAFAYGTIYVGNSGVGSFNQTGGTNRGGPICVGYLSGSTGTYALSGTGVIVGANEYIGYDGFGLFNQSGGMNGQFPLGQSLYLGYAGNSTGIYVLSSTGQLSASSRDEYVGYGAMGMFSQTGGTNAVANLTIGYQAGATGAYTLSGAALLSGPGTEIVGNNGVGTFDQTGGTNLLAIDGYIYLGYGGGSTGTYNLSNTGAITGTYASIQIGRQGTGIFDQTGGTNTIYQIFLGSSGTYSMSGGIIACDDFAQTGGSASFANLAIDSNDIFEYDLGTTGFMATSSLSAASETIGTYGLFNQTGGTNTTKTLTLAASGEYYMRAGTLLCQVVNQTGGTAIFVNNNNQPQPVVTIGPGYIGQYNQSGGICTLVGIPLNVGGPVGSTGTFNLSGTGLLTGYGVCVGSLGFGNLNQTGGTISLSETVGSSSIGILNQSGGTNAATTLTLGQNSGSTGTYILSGGTLSTSNTEFVGYSGIGVFNQSGGINSISNHYGLEICLAIGTSAKGTYDLSAGQLEVSNGENVGNGYQAIFNQTGGTNSLGGSLQVGSVNTSTYYLSGGSLSAAGREFVGNGYSGVFNQSGGANTIGNTLIVGCYDNSTGTYVLSGSGSLTTGADESIGFGNSITYGNGSFIQTGGINTIAGNLNLGGNSGTGSYTLSGTGELSVGTAEYIGVNGLGTFYQTGGTNATATLFLNQSGSGSYLLQGGTLDAGTIYFSAGAVFTQTGGTLTATTINFSAGATLTQTGGLLSYTTFNQDSGNYSPGPLALSGSGCGTTFNLICGTLSSPTININAGGTFAMSGGALCSTALNLNGGFLSLPAIVLDSGTPEATIPVPAGANPPVLNLVSGTVGGVDEYLGVSPGTFNYSVTGALNIDAGSFYVGYAQGSTAAFSLSETGTLTVTSNEEIGNCGVGIFIQSGGCNLLNVVNSDGELLLGNNAGSTGTYILSGGSLIVKAASYDIGSGEFIGSTGLGIFDQTGGTNAARALYVQGGPSAYNLSGGTLTAATEITSGVFNQTGGTNVLGTCAPVTRFGNGLYVGYFAQGTYDLSGGQLSVGSDEYVGADFGSAVFNQTGGSNVCGALLIGNLGVGEYRLTGGYLAVSGTLSLSQGGSGTLCIANVTANAASAINDGEIRLTDPVGATAAGDLTATGDFTQTSTGELDIALGGLLAGSQYSVLDVFGDAALDGTLDVSLANGFIPSFGDRFEVIDAGSLTGTFANVILPDEAHYSLTYTSDGVFVTVLPEPNTLAVMILGGAGLLARRRVRRQRDFYRSLAALR